MQAKSFNLSAQGASHIKKNKECQDYSLSFYDDNFAFAVVCDGHGGDDYVRSAYGSEFACKVAKRNITDFVNSVNLEDLNINSKQLITNLEASIINDWNEEVKKHFNENPFSESEMSALSNKAKKKYFQDNRIECAYGTTLIAVAVTKEYWFGIHIGDGKCVAVKPESKFVQPIPWDEKCFLNATTSLCDSDALENFRYIYSSEKLPVAVFIGSDGIDDCFSNDRQLFNLYKTVLYSFATTDFDKAIDDLRDYLPRLSSKGSGDDVSVAAILDLDLISQIDAVKEFDREKEKAHVEENARREAEKSEAERLRIEKEHQTNTDKNVSNDDKQHEYLICSYCNAKIPTNSKFCSECGAKIHSDESFAFPDGKCPDTVVQEVISANDRSESEDNTVISSDGIQICEETEQKKEEDTDFPIMENLRNDVEISEISDKEEQQQYDVIITDSNQK